MKTRNMFITGLFVYGMTVGLPACNDEETPVTPDTEQSGTDDAETVKTETFYIETEECGLRTVTFLNQNQDVKYSFDICRGGDDTDEEAILTLSVLTEEEMAQYNTDNAVNYTLLPDDCYEFTKEFSGFTAEAPVQTAEVTLKAKIGQLDFSDADYVLPLKLTSTAGKVDEKRNLIILKPSVTTPTVSFVGSLETSPISVYQEDAASMSEEITFKLTLDRDNQGWNFAVNVETDVTALNALVDAYNNDNSTSCTLLPATCYAVTIPTFSGSSMQAELKVTISSLSSLEADKDYLLPLKLKECTDALSFGLDQRVIYIPVSKFSMLKVPISLNNMYIVSAAADGFRTKLYDGDKTTIWQSIWNTATEQGWIYSPATKPYDAIYGVYIDIDFNERTMTRNVRLDFSLETLRRENKNEPKKTAFYGWTGSAWEKIEEVDDLFEGAPTDTGQYPYTLTKMLSLNKPITKVRISFLTNSADSSLTSENETNPCIANVRLSELEVWGY